MKKPSLLVIFLTVFIDLVGFGIVLPQLPKYADRFGAEPYQIGLIIASYSLMQFFFSPLWGRLSDRIGRRPVLLISNAGSAISYTLFAVGSLFQNQTGLWILLVSRVFAGICGANLSVASAYIADVTTPVNRSKRMAMSGVACGCGFIIGPALSSFSASLFGLTGPGSVAAVLCAFNFVLGCFILTESLQPSSEHAASRPKLAQWSHTLRQPKLGGLVGVFFLATSCFACFESTLPLLLSDRFNYDEKHVGYLFAFCGLITVFIQGGVIGRLVKRFGEAQLIFGSLLVVAASMTVIPFAPHLTELLLGLALLSGGWGVNRAPTMGLISLSSPPGEQGATLGVAQSAGTLARIVGPIFATTLYGIRPALPFVICSVIAVGAGLVTWQNLCRTRPPLSAADLHKVDLA